MFLPPWPHDHFWLTSKEEILAVFNIEVPSYVFVKSSLSHTWREISSFQPVTLPPTKREITFSLVAPVVDSSYYSETRILNIFHVTLVEFIVPSTLASTSLSTDLILGNVSNECQLRVCMRPLFVGSRSSVTLVRLSL